MWLQWSPSPFALPVNLCARGWVTLSTAPSLIIPQALLSLRPPPSSLRLSFHQPLIWMTDRAVRNPAHMTAGCWHQVLSQHKTQTRQNCVLSPIAFSHLTCSKKKKVKRPTNMTPFIRGFTLGSIQSRMLHRLQGNSFEDESDTLWSWSYLQTVVVRINVVENIVTNLKT